MLQRSARLYRAADIQGLKFYKYLGARSLFHPVQSDKRRLSHRSSTLLQIIHFSSFSVIILFCRYKDELTPPSLQNSV
jgi:hypothetical protein